MSETFIHENPALLAIGMLRLRYQESEADRAPVELEFEDIEGIQARFREWAESCLAGKATEDLTHDELDALRQMDERHKYRMPKLLVEALGLWRFATYADAMEAGVSAVQQLELVKSWQ